MTLFSKTKFSVIFVAVINEIVFCQIPSSPFDSAKPDQPKPRTQDDLFRTLSKSKASVWVDTNKGNVFSTSIGSSHLEKKNQIHNDPGGHSNNMLLTLLIQPDSERPITAVPPNSRASNLKPILLLLQQQHDLSGILLEKQEKLEKMNIQLQQQIKNQHTLIIEFLDHIKLFLEVMKTQSHPTDKLSKDSLDLIKKKLNSKVLQDRSHSTSSSSTANAIVTAAGNSQKRPDDPIIQPIIPDQTYPLVQPDYASQTNLPSAASQQEQLNPVSPLIFTENNQQILANSPSLSPVSAVNKIAIETPLTPVNNATVQSGMTLNNQDQQINKNGSIILELSTRAPVNLPRRSKLRFNRKDKAIVASSASEVKGLYRDIDIQDIGQELETA